MGSIMNRALSRGSLSLRLMGRFALSLWLTTSLMGVLGASVAFAQTGVADPDIRNIRPVVMLLVDTSGSMERLPGGPDAPLPVCTGGTSSASQRDRWTSVVEALTGTWSDTDYYCTAINRSVYSGSPDFNYYLPYNRPPLAVPQNNDGILDVYLDRIKFGLMTFDGVYTFSDSHPLLVPRTTFTGRLADNVGSLGGYSYGDPRPLSFPGCTTTFMVDSGARNASAPSGRLISVGTETDDSSLINQNIQSQLLAVRPFGGTPTASLLHDYRYYVANHPDVTADDPFRACRSRFAVVLTDGQPDEDFRDARFNCEGTPGGCPYQRTRDIAAELCDYNGSSATCVGDLDGVFVVAFDVSDPTALAELDSIALAGGTTAALRATNRDDLMRRLSEVLDRTAPGNTTRSRPSFVTGSSTFNATGAARQYEFNAGFRVGTDTTPWSGVLERTAFICDDASADPLTPVREPVANRVRFDAKLNTQASRTLYTVTTPDPNDLDQNLVGTDATAVPLGSTVLAGTVTGLRMRAFDTAITPDYFGIATGSVATKAARRDAIVNWVQGTTPDRQDTTCWADRTRWDDGCASRMGDIYHSNPVAVGPPRIDIADEAYNMFRRDVADRPTVVYVGTNDGVLHAFAAEDWRCPPGGLPSGARLSCDALDRFEAGQEIWGFVPPILLPKLESATNSHQIMLDGTPVVRDIFYRRLPTDTPSGDIYHTVLVMGFRGGAPGYFALDVTDPLEPEFLWQFVGEQPTGSGGGAARRVTPLGNSYGVPAIGQVLVDVGGVLQERAIALLPGGAGDVEADRARTTGPVGCPGQGVGQPPVTSGTLNARSRQRCWSNTGRVLTWVDIVTGEVINSFDETTFNAPVTGGVSLYPGDVGTTASRAFLTDADGVMWAVDFSARNPSSWAVRPFHDIFWDAGATEGQPAYNPPLVSTDDDGNLVVLQATGDIDRLDGPAQNRVVSLTERRTFSAAGAASYTTALNWELRLRAGEQVTGALELFEGRVYFASFESGVAADACDIGQSRIWGLAYRESTSSVAPGYLNVAGAFPAAGFEGTPGAGVYDTHFRGPYDQRLVLGVGVTQRPTCVQGAQEIDPFIGQRYRVNNVGGGTFVLTAQMSGGSSTAGGAIETVNEQLQSPPSFTTVQSFAGQVDY